MQHVPAADRIPGDHRHDGLGQAPDLHLQVGDVEAPDRRAFGDVAGVAAHVLIAARAERERSSPVKMITPTSVSSRARSNASDTSTSVCGRNALRTSGRLIVIFAMPSPLSS